MSRTHRRYTSKGRILQTPAPRVTPTPRDAAFSDYQTYAKARYMIKMPRKPKP